MFVAQKHRQCYCQQIVLKMQDENYSQVSIAPTAL